MDPLEQKEQEKKTLCSPQLEENKTQESQIEDVLCDLNAWQIKRLAIVCLILMPGGTLMTAMPFATYQQDFWCAALGKSNETLNICVKDCAKYEFDQSEFYNSIRMDYGLICERQYLETLAKLSLFGGYGVGTFVVGIISDNFGRKTGLIISSQALLCSGVMVTFMPTFLGFTILWFIVGVSCIAVFTVGFVWSLELAAQDSKIVVTLMTGIIFSLGLLLGISFAYWVRDYRAYHQVFAGLHLITPILLILIPESPRWLVSQKKTEKLEEAICTLTKIAKSKKLQFDPISFKCGELTKHAISDDVDHFSFILTKPLLRTRAFTMFFCWITVAFVLYSISMNMKSLTGSLFLNMALTGIFGFMGKIAGFLILAKFLTRKYPFIIMFLITAVTCGLCSTLDPLDPTQRSVLSGLVVLTIMCLSCIFSIIWLYTAEMYPTAIRNFGVGSSSLMGRIGGAGCAFIAYLIEIHPGLPFMVFSGMCLIAGCLACSLPETGTLPPPSSMKEIEQRER